MARVGEMAELVRQLGVAQQQVASLTLGQTPSIDRKLGSIIDTRVINRIDTFDGDDNSRKQRCVVFESTAGLVDLDMVLNAAESAADALDLDFGSSTPDIQPPRMKALCHLLASTKAQRRDSLEKTEGRVRAEVWKQAGCHADWHLEARVVRCGDTWRRCMGDSLEDLGE